MKVELEIADKVWASFCLMCERNNWKPDEMASSVLWGTVQMQDPALQTRAKQAAEQFLMDSPEFNEAWERLKPDYLE